MKRTLLYSNLILLIVLTTSCSNKGLQKNLTMAQRFQIGKEQIQKENYMEAKLTFEALSYLSAGSSIIDSVQYLLGDVYYHLDEYISAAAEFKRLIRDIPNSPLTDDAQFKIAMCYYELSPKYSLDQEYTLEGLKQFQVFLENYPNSPLVSEATKKFKDLRTKLAKKDYTAGVQYKKMGLQKSAIIYFDLVISDYYDTIFYQKALYEKAECLIDQKEYGKALLILQNFVIRFPQSEKIEDAKKKLEDIKSKVQSNPSANAGKNSK